MNKYKQMLKCMLILAITVSWTACKEDETPMLTVEPMQLNFDGEASSHLISVVSNTDWTIDAIDSDWIRVDKTSGKGDGNMRQVDVFIDKNSVEDRVGVITVRAGSEVKTVTVSQRSATFGTPYLSRSIGANLSLSGTTLNVPYAGFHGDESFTLSVTAHGVSVAGIDEVKNFPVALTASEGIIEIPLSGMPTSAGTVNLSVTTDYPGYSILPITVLIGKLSFGQPYLSGAFEIMKDAAGKSLVVPYSGAAGYESFTVSVSVSGAAADGIHPFEPFPVTVNAAKGSFSIPVSGMPTTSGSITFGFASSFPGTFIEGLNTVVYSKIHLDMNFNLMRLGGDEIGNRAGTTVNPDVTPWDITTDPGKVNLPADAVYMSCSATTLGPGIFGTGAGTTAGGGTFSDTYKQLRGLVGAWTGLRVYEAPGYVLFGTSSGDGYLVTPPLSDISGTADVRLSFRIAKRVHTATVVKVTVSGGGSILGNTTTPTVSTFPIAAAGSWEQKALIITGATSTTAIRFENNASASDARKFGLDDLIITSIETN